MSRSSSEISWKRLFWYVLAGSRGGPNYRVAEHHIRALEKNHLVSSAGEKYGKLYFLSPEMEAHLPLFDEIWAQIRPRV
ncbi:hypothetical protein E6H15_08710 [Candidatus Bathyarchaeota archaeon]|nr:MAG: hypothetical protein E6H15_08710 [Candidatus Bathyarchaeota archaeon]